MTFGGVRHVGDIKVVELCDEAQSILTLQSGMLFLQLLHLFIDFSINNYQENCSS